MDLRKKRVQLLIVLIIITIALLIGSFAWYSFNQRVVNEFEIKTPPNVNLHDDFDGGPQKDVYVENSGQRDVFVRVRLSEFMQIGNNSLVPGAIKDDPNTWTAHIPNAAGECQTCIDNPNLEWFHTYYEWTMGGRKFYRPAQESVKGYGDPDNPDAVDSDGNPVPYKEPEVVGDTTDYAAMLKTAFAGDSDILALITKFLDYTQVFTDDDYTDLQAAIESLKDTAEDITIWTNPEDPEEVMTLSQIQLTKSSAPVGTIGYPGNEIAPKMVISMEEWKTGSNDRAPYAKGDFWVIDKDGWAYWANPLKPGEATGLLLSNVERTEKYPSDDTYYAIDVWLQAVTADDLVRFSWSADMDGGGGITAEGLLLMSLGKGNFVYSETDDKFYLDCGNNVYAPIDTSSIDNILNANKDTITGKFIGAPEGGVNGTGIKTGDTIKVQVTTADGPIVEDVELTAMRIVTGRDGMSYIDLGDGSFAMTVEYNESGEPYEPYRTTGLGLAYDGNGEQRPFIRVWPGGADGIPGSAYDKYENPYVELEDETVMHYLGNGVYVKTDGVDAFGRPIDIPGVYYLHTGDGSVSELADIEAFGLSLKSGDLFEFHPESDGGEGYKPLTEEEFDPDNDYHFQFVGMVQGTNGQWYIQTEDEVIITSGENAGTHENPQGESTYITINPGGNGEGGLDVLGNDTNVFVWAKKPGTDDQYSKFSEPFLKGIKKEDLLPNGDGFMVDGANWRVLDIDEFGNRLVLCDSLAGNKVTMGQSIYSNSSVKSEMQKIMATLPTINKYALPVETPVWYRQITPGYYGGTVSLVAPGDYGQEYIFTTAELSKPKNVDGNWSTTGAEAFALSLSEAIRYSESIENCNDSWWLRSAGKGCSCGTKLNTVAGYITVNAGASQYVQKSEPLATQICNNHDGLSYVTDTAASRSIYTMGNYTDSFRCRAAMWVRFSDAEKLASDIASGKVEMPVFQYPAP